MVIVSCNNDPISSSFLPLLFSYSLIEFGKDVENSLHVLSEQTEGK